MMQPTIALEEHLEDLRLTTEALLEAADTPESIDPLLNTREQQIRALARTVEQGHWTVSQRAKLRNLIEAGGGVRKSLALQREMLRKRLDELRTAKQAQTRITPYRESTPRRLNVKL